MIRRLSLVLVACVLFPGTAAACPVSDDPDKTIAALRTCDESQLRKLFSSRRAGPMPGWGAAARGYWRWYPDLEGFGQPADRLVTDAVWQGKVFYTRADGGHLVNRVLGDRRTFPAVVRYGRANLDGRRAIIVDYAAARDPLALIFRDEIRRVQPGIYLGLGWWNTEPPGWPGPDHIWFVLDFLHSDPEPSCLLCPRR